jgi:hypothetical protein
MPEPEQAPGGCAAMRSNAHNRRPPAGDDDVQAWLVIGLIFFGVTLVVFGPLIWVVAHSTL